MKTLFTVEGVINLANGTVALTGSVEGARLTSGRRGMVATSFGDVEIEILNIGVGDPHLQKPNMQMVLSKLLKGDSRLLNGETLIFD